MKLRLRLNAQAGADRFRLRMRPLPPGRYLVIVTAVAADGGRALPASRLVSIPRR